MAFDLDEEELEETRKMHGLGSFKEKKKSKKIYAVYKGDEYIDQGTAEELAKKFNVKIKTISFWNTPANKKRAEKEVKTHKRGGQKIAIVIE